MFEDPVYFNSSGKGRLMKIHVSLIIGMLLLSQAFSSPAAALNCQNPQTQTDMNRCASIELEAETKKLNKTYRDFQTKLNSTQRQQLKKVQLAWIKFKDLACKFETSGSYGGSVYPMVLSNCLTEKTQQRNKELEVLGVCQEGDLRCPAW